MNEAQILEVREGVVDLYHGYGRAHSACMRSEPMGREDTGGTVAGRISNRGVRCSFVAALFFSFLGVFALLIQPVCEAQDPLLRSPEGWPGESTGDSDCVYRYPVVKPA